MMLLIGVTGQGGGGKTEVCAYFKSKGYFIIDGDEIAHLVTNTNTDLLAELKENFGASIFNEDGSLNRKILGSLVFSDPDKLKMLNKITHKYILAEFDVLVSKAISNGERAVFIDAAALIESGYHKKCDYIIYVKAPLEKRIERVLKRDGITLKDARMRLTSQKKDEFYESNCDFVVINDDDKNRLKIQLDKILEKIIGDK